jgi:hypothetical protein
MAIRRAAQFKAMVKRRLIRVFDETLKAVTETVFQLDSDFDLFIADDTVHILRPGAFEQLADIDTEILDQAGKKTAALDATVPGIRFSTIAPYVSRHKRAARIIASLLRRGDLADISATNLRRECRRNGISVDAIDGQLVPDKGQELAFCTFSTDVATWYPSSPENGNNMKRAAGKALGSESVATSAAVVSSLSNVNH